MSKTQKTEAFPLEIVPFEDCIVIIHKNEKYNVLAITKSKKGGVREAHVRESVLRDVEGNQHNRKIYYTEYEKVWKIEKETDESKVKMLREASLKKKQEGNKKGKRVMNSNIQDKQDNQDKNEDNSNKDSNTSDNDVNGLIADDGLKETNNTGEGSLPFDKAINSVKKQKLNIDINDMQNYFEERISKLEREVINLQQNHKKEEIIVGKMTQAEGELFELLAVSEKTKYYISQDSNGVKHPEKKHNMCSYYKNMNKPCQSKTSVNNKYESAQGVYVSLALFGRKSVRNMPSKEAYGYLKQCALCGPCVTAYAKSTDMVDIIRRQDMCLLCKVKRKSTTSNSKDNNGIQTCLDCAKLYQNDDDCHILNKTFGLLRNMYPKLNIQMENQKHVTYQTKSMSIDFIIRGTTSSNMNFLFVIEKDEDKHKDYKKEEEIRKMRDQTIGLMKSMYKNIKVVMIRYNPNASYVEGEKSHNMYTSIERHIILRQWIIWYIMNIKEVRKTCVWYFWYDETSRKMLMDPQFDGFAMIYHAPKCPSNNDWKWSPEPSEGSSEKYEKIQDNVVEIDETLGKWREEDAMSDYPKGFIVTN